LQAARRCALIALYVLVAAAMTLLWWLSPLAALLVFLGMSGIHFGEDWAMLPSGLLRAMAGMAVITTAAFGQQDRVRGPVRRAHRIAARSHDRTLGPGGCALTWLVTLVGIEAAWRSGHRAWVMACCACFTGSLAAPSSGSRCFSRASMPRSTGDPCSAPCRAPAHVAPSTRACGSRFLTLSIWFGWMRWAHVVSPLVSSAEAFRLLSIVAAPISRSRSRSSGGSTF